MGVFVYVYTQHAKCAEFSRLYSSDVKGVTTSRTDAASNQHHVAVNVDGVMKTRSV